VSGDVFIDSYTSASFANKSVGTGKTISVSGISISGSDAGNYTFNTSASTTADITPKPVNMTGARPYDTTNLASFSILSVSNKAAAGDNVTVASDAGTLAGAGVGIQPFMGAASLALGGSDAPNYTTSGATGTVVIGAWTLTRFYNPVTMGDSVLNTVKGGSTVPLKFNVYQDRATRTSGPMWEPSNRSSCNTSPAAVAPMKIRSTSSQRAERRCGTMRWHTNSCRIGRHRKRLAFAIE